MPRTNHGERTHALLHQRPAGAGTSRIVECRATPCARRGGPMDVFPQTQERSQPQMTGPLVVLAAAVVLLLLFAGAVDFLTEWMWFSSLNFASIFTTTLIARVALFAIGALVFLALFAVNV